MKNLFQIWWAYNPGGLLPGFYGISIQIFCSLLCSFVLYSMVFCNRLVFECFVPNIWLLFENMYLLSCWFHCVEIFYIKFRFCEAFTIINSVTRILLIETLYKYNNNTVFVDVIDIYGPHFFINGSPVPSTPEA